MPTTGKNVMISTDEIEVQAARSNHGYGAYNAVIHHRKMEDDRARFAMQLISDAIRLPLADSGKEDSAGRAVLARLEAKQIVDLCFEVADLTYDRIRDEKRYVQLPSIAEIEAAYKDTN
jgi:hypothetical protein